MFPAPHLYLTRQDEYLFMNSFKGHCWVLRWTKQCGDDRGEESIPVFKEFTT